MKSKEEKSVLISIHPYWVFLIIARKMGWDIDKEKTIEVRKNFPKNKDWNRNVEIYCSKDKKSFSKIPKEYQPLMEKFLGKVIGEFVCDRIDEYKYRLTTYEETLWKSRYISKEELAKTCLSIGEINDYLNGKNGYGLHISQFKIYDKPKELDEFYQECKGVCVSTAKKILCLKAKTLKTFGCDRKIPLKRPPQSWCYVEELK